MTPFQQFQVWLRRAGTGQRVLAGVACLVVLALLAWLVRPVDRDAELDVASGAGAGQTQTTAPVDASGSASTVAAEGTAETGADGGSSIAGASSPTGAADSGTGAQPTGDDQQATGQDAGKQCPVGQDQGATDRRVRVAITLINIAGAAGNQTIGVPAPDTQREQWQIVADDINANGGAGCRQLALEFHTVNPINPSDTQQKCLEIANSEPFVVIDSGSLTQVGASDCIPNNQIPMVANFLTQDQVETYQPYYISATGLLGDMIYNGVRAFHQQGHFDAAKGFEKVGVLYRTCRPAPVQIMRSSLKAVGISGNEIVEFNLGCAPSQQNTPVEWQQAALTFKNAGVTHVTAADVGDMVNFTPAAAQQNFEPQYLIADNKVTGTQTGTQQPDAENFDGAFSASADQYGEENTPGIAASEATQRCNQIFAANGYPPVQEQQVGYGGVACNMLGLVKAMIDNSTELRQELLVNGLQSVGIHPTSFPQGPVDFSATPPGVGYGRALWRPVVYKASCTCFQVADATFRPPFA